MRPGTRLRRGSHSALPSSFVVFIAVTFAGPSVALARDLTFAQRVEAQRAIERVYYIHRSGGARGFEATVTDALLAKKVRTYLGESVALEEFWKTPVTATMLRREVDRMTAGSRLPERLSELRAALGHDERLLAETLARETLVDRLCRSFLAADTRVATRDWDTWWAESAPRFDPYRARTVVEESAIHGALTGNGGVVPDVVACTVQDVWAAGRDRILPIGVLIDGMVWTGSEAIVWSGNGSRYDPATDTWRPTTMLGAPTTRSHHTAVWTGSEMIVWGGSTGSSQYLNTGGRYDPVADSWTPTSTVDAPPPTANHVAVWTGSKMIVWGGDYQNNQGGRYDPATDSWQATSLVGVPAGRSSAGAVWTGTQMIVWGGSALGGGGRYDPVTDLWSPVSPLNAPKDHPVGHSAVWTGSRMLVWGGCNSGFAPGGGLYDPVNDSWVPVTSAGAPTNRCNHATVWTGTEMIIWGGKEFITSYPQPWLNTGARYNPATDTWQEISAVNTPAASSVAKAVWTSDLMVTFGGTAMNGGRYRLATDSWTPTFSAQNWPLPSAQPASVWTGAEFIVWSGPGLNQSGRYDPMTDSWKTVDTSGAPSARTAETAVWVDGWMVIWGGESSGTPLATGARYSPQTDSWNEMILEDNTPLARVGHSAIRTGTRMTVWGGQGGGGLLADGGQYDPRSDLWTPIPPDGAPAPRRDHAAVWTGHEMVIWGGDVGGGVGTDTGGRFDPAANAGAGAWIATSTSGAPSARLGHTVVWTGSRMIVWGGGSDSSGGQYDPAADSWTPTATAGAPGPRTAHAVVWTGAQMIVWGGALSTPQSFSALSTGGVYDPLADIWTPTTGVSAPLARFHQAAAWTGGAMLVWGGSFDAGSNPLNDRVMHWYGSASATPPADLDGDGVLSCQDCDDGNPAVWGVPGEATDLLFNDDDVTLVWSPPLAGGADAVSYDLLRSDTASDFVSAGVCLASGTPDPLAVDSDTPAAGKFFFYLARARNACPGGVGTAGAGSSGVPRAALVCP
jgi:hypothetical protein